VDFLPYVHVLLLEPWLLAAAVELAAGVVAWATAVIAVVLIPSGTASEPHIEEHAPLDDAPAADVFVEICNAYLEYSRRLWKSQETNFAVYEDKIMPK